MQGQVDECVFFKDRYIYVLDTNVSILTKLSIKENDKIIKQMRLAGLKLTVEADMRDFLGVKIDRKKDG